MSGTARLGLGTVQFGLPYGITNQAGRVQQDEAAEILRFALAHGVNLLDTAHLYGESETAIGNALPPGASVRIVTKTPKFGRTPGGGAAGSSLIAAFHQSLRKLRRENLYGLMLHDAGDLLGPSGPELWSAMRELKDQALVQMIGVSAYEAEEIERVLDAYPVDLVQLPYNPLDDRLVRGGQLARLAAAGVEVHARSLFLQGLLLQPPEQIPARFPGVRRGVERMLAEFADRGISALDGVLALALQRSEISRFVCGVTTAGELQAIVLAAAKAQGAERPTTFTLSSPIDPRELNPARWAELA